jgi:hypothetical protein
VVLVACVVVELEDLKFPVVVVAAALPPDVAAAPSVVEPALVLEEGDCEDDCEDDWESEDKVCQLGTISLHWAHTTALSVLPSQD